MDSGITSGRRWRPLALLVASLVLIGGSATMYEQHADRPAELLSAPAGQPTSPTGAAPAKVNHAAVGSNSAPSPAPAPSLAPAPSPAPGQRSTPTPTPTLTSTPARTRPMLEVVALLRPHQARRGPDARSAPLGIVPAKTPITEARTVLPVLQRKGKWLKVRLPGRPNGHAGWIRRHATARFVTDWHVVIDRSRRQVAVYQAGRRVRLFSAVVGGPSTPTPRGEFFVEEAIALRAGDPGSPFALALSARSYVLQEFAGGPGQIAVHGLLNVGGVLGTAVSHGCVRVDTAAIRWLAFRIGPGVPVTITN